PGPHSGEAGGLAPPRRRPLVPGLRGPRPRLDRRAGRPGRRRRLPGAGAHRRRAPAPQTANPSAPHPPGRHPPPRRPPRRPPPTPRPAGPARQRELAADVLAQAGQFDPALTPDTVGWLAERSGLPVVVKGVLRGDGELGWRVGAG